MKQKIFSIFLFQMLLFTVPLFAHGAVYINEIAWMGSSSNANAEWIEIHNDGTDEIDISGWTISGSLSITISDGKNIVGGGYFLLERTSDNTIPEITADQIYTGALANTGGNLTLKDKDGNVVDYLEYSSGWPAGDNTTKETMQKLSGSWYTANPTSKSPTQNNVLENTQKTSTNNNQNTLSSINSNNTNPTQSQKNSYREISAKIIINESTIPANVSYDFKGIIYGNYGEELESGLVFWNFGDGGTKKASSFETVSHIYKFPGEYVVSFQYFKNSNSKEYDAEAKVNIKVIQAELFISKIGNIESPYIELENRSSYEIDLTDWKLVASGKIFTFPSGTYIKAGRKNLFDLEFLGFNISDINPIVLFRPGFQIESVYPLGYSINNTIRNTSVSKNVYLGKEIQKDINTQSETIDLNLLDKQEAGAVFSGMPLPPWLMLVILIFLATLSIYFIQNKKNKNTEIDIENIKADDINIIE